MIRESKLNPDNAAFRETVPAGEYFLKVVKAGETLRILDLEATRPPIPCSTTPIILPSATAPWTPSASRATSTSPPAQS